MALFFLGQQPLTFAVEVRGAVMQHAITVPFVLTGTVRRQIVGTITVPFVLGHTYKLSDKSNAALIDAARTITVPFTPKGLLNVTQSGATAGSLTYDNAIDVPFVLSEKAGVGALASGGPGSPVVPVPIGLGQTYGLSDKSNTALVDAARTIATPIVLTGTVGPIGNLRSPALVHFDGTNFIARTAGTGTGDNDLSGQANFTAAIVFDPELIHVGQSCTVVAKDDGSTQRAWRVEWDATTALVTVTVCSSADGSNRSSRTTVATVRTRSVLAFTWDSTDLRLYVGGASSEGAQTDVGTPGAMATSTEPLSFGVHDPSGGGTAPMKGAVYMLAVFNSTLSAGDVAKIGADCSIAYDVLASSNLKALWHPDQIESNGTHAQYYRWRDQKNALDLAPGFVSGGNLPDIIPSDTLKPLTRRNDWNINFADTGVRAQNLSSTYALSVPPDYPIRRLYTGVATVPNIAAGSNWRRFKNDVTVVLFGYKTTGTNSVVAVRCYGFELLFDRPSQTVFANVGVDTSLTNQNDRYTFGVANIAGFGEATSVALVVRYNSSDDRLDIFLGASKYTGAVTATSSFSDSFALLLSDQMDYIAALAIPACLPDAGVQALLSGLNGTADPIELGQRFRYVGQGVAEGLSHIFPDYPPQFPTDPDPPAVLTPLPLDQIPQTSILPPSVQDSMEPIDFLFVDEPYPVREAETIDDTGTVQTIFGDPLPSVVSVVADVGHNVVAVANAGPTDAGQVITWWEVEYVSGGTETFVQIDYNGANDFSTNHNHTDTFVIPLGMDFRDKRIRFVVQAVADASQVWKSLYFRMADVDEFNNDPPQTIIVPGPSQPSPPTISDLEITIAQQALVLKQKSEAARLTLRIASNSRYKLTRPFLDTTRDVGVEFELMSVLSDFYRAGSDFRTHRVRAIDIGFLDRLAVEYYGPGNEQLWWVIAYANAIVDPEQDMHSGQALFIPSRSSLQTFLSRKPVR